MTHKEEMKEYIYGSADVVGLMCLKVFVKGDDLLYDRLQEPAMKLGSAFQKVNFLRDIKMDTEILQRHYFPELNGNVLTHEIKERLIAEIKNDFDASLTRGSFFYPAGRNWPLPSPIIITGPCLEKSSEVLRKPSEIHVYAYPA